MTSILHISSSPKGEAAESWIAAQALITGLLQRQVGATLSTRRLDQTPPSPISAQFTADMVNHQTPESARDVAALQESEALIEELVAADVLILSMPMHNFAVPASFKAWIDQIVRFGRTFQSTPTGKVGLLADRPTYIVIASGGYFSADDATQPDFLTPYLKAILPTIGIKDLTFITAEGMSRGPEAADAARAQANASIQDVLAR